MSKAQALATVEPSTVNLPANVESLGEMFEWENPIEHADRINLPRIGTSKDAPFFKLPDGTMVPELVGHLLCAPLSPRRWYQDSWSQDKHESPDCWSSDGVRPDPSIAQPEHKTCAGCPQDQWGTARASDGSEGNGKACRQYRRHVLMFDDAVLPHLWDVSPLGLRAVDEFLVKYATTPAHMVVVQGRKRPLPLQLARLKITLTARAGKSGSAMIPVYEVVGWASDERAAELLAAKKAFVDQAASEQIVEEPAAHGGGNGDGVDPNGDEPPPF